MDNTESFKEKLDQQYEWPSLYTFKFIAPLDKVDEVKALFPGHNIREKASRNGNYISLSVDMMVQSSDTVVNIYIKVHELGGGIISL